MKARAIKDLYTQDPARVLIGQKPMFYQSIKHSKKRVLLFYRKS